MTTSQVVELADNGCLLLPGLLSRPETQAAMGSLARIHYTDYVRQGGRRERAFALNQVPVELVRRVEQVFRRCVAPGIADSMHVRRVSLLSSRPGAAAQDWHRDAPAPGDGKIRGENQFAVFVAAGDYPEDCGFTEVLTDTHCKSKRYRFTPVAAVVESEAPAAVMGPVDMGSGYAFSSSLVHRGGANSSAVNRNMLVFVLDTEGGSDPNYPLSETVASRTRSKAK